MQESKATSDESPQRLSEPVIKLDQVKSLVEGGLLDELLVKSPAFAALHERLAAMETHSSTVQQTLEQIGGQLQRIVQAIQAPPPDGGAEAEPASPAVSAGSLREWAPLINALASAALAPREASPSASLKHSMGEVLELLKVFTQIQSTVNESNAIAYKTMQAVLKGERPVAAPAAVAAGEAG